MVACMIVAIGVLGISAGTIADYLAEMTGYLSQAGTVATLAADGKLSRSTAVSRLASLTELAEECFYQAATSGATTRLDAKILYLCAAASLSIRLAYEGYRDYSPDQVKAAAQLNKLIQTLVDEYLGR